MSYIVPETKDLQRRMKAVLDQKPSRTWIRGEAVREGRGYFEATPDLEFWKATIEGESLSPPLSLPGDSDSSEFEAGFQPTSREGPEGRGCDRRGGVSRSSVGVAIGLYGVAKRVGAYWSGGRRLG